MLVHYSADVNMVVIESFTLFSHI